MEGPSLQIPNPQSPPFPLPLSPLFSVRTPTATVTDLGTEFGVEVDKQGGTTSHVFRGSVQLTVCAVDGRGAGRPVVIGENQSVCVERRQNGDGPQVVLRRGVADSTAFVRNLQEFEDKTVLGPFHRWEVLSRELLKREHLVAYYDFQPDRRNLRMLRNRAATGEQFDGRIYDLNWVHGRFPGKYALRFFSQWSGSGVRVDLPSEYRRITAAAWVKVDRLPNPFAMLLASDGWCRNGNFQWLIEQGGSMAVNVTGAVDNIRSEPVFNAGCLGRWCHVAVVCDHVAGQVAFYLNGDPVGGHVINSDTACPAQIGPAMIGNWDKKSPQ